MRFLLPVLNRFWLILAAVALLPLQWACSSKITTTPATPTSSSIPSAELIPSLSLAPVPLSTAPGSGLWVVGGVVGDVTTGSSPSTIGAAVVDLAVNNTAETTDAVWINTPSGAVSLPYSASITYLSYKFSVYGGTVNWLAGGSFGMSVTTSLGTAFGSLGAVPGNIQFSANGASVTALDDGQYYAGYVVETSSPYTATYESTYGTSISNPFTYPASAYPATSMTYDAIYAAESWTTSLTGSAGAKGAFAAAELATGAFTR